MKPWHLTFSILLFEILLNIGCNKTTSQPDTMPATDSSKDLYVRVLEYPAGTPIAGAQYSLMKCDFSNFPGCLLDTPASKWFSDIHGIIHIKASDTADGKWDSGLFQQQVTKEGFWYRLSFDTLTSDQSGRHAVVYLYPYAWLRVHFQDSVDLSGSGSFKVYFSLNTFIPEYVNSQNPWITYHLMGLNFPTTLLIKTTAFIPNEIGVDRDSTGVHGILYYDQIRTAGKLDTLDWNVVAVRK